MATDAGTVFVEVQAKIDKFKTNLKGAENRLKKFGSRTKSFISNNKTLIAGAMAGVGAGVAKVIHAYGVQEEAIAKLNQSLKNQGNFSEEASKDLQDYASSLQKVTTFGDETIIGAQSLIASFGFEGQALKDLTKATLDLATAKGMDLNAAADLVSKSVGSTTNALTRYGIEVNGVAGSTERASSAVENINKLFGGQAETVRQTTLGQVQALGNAFGDLQETIGSFIAGEGTSLVTVLTSWIEKLDTSLKLIRDQTKMWGGFGETLKRVGLEAVRSIAERLLDMSNSMLAFGPIFKLLKIDIDDVKASLNRQIDSWQATINKSQESGTVAKKTEEKKRQEIDKTTKKKIESDNKADQEQARIADVRMKRWQKLNAEQMEAEREKAEYLKETQYDYTAFAMDTANQMFAQFGQGVADMIMESRKFADVIQNIWKDIARAVIAEIAKMIAKWIAFQVLTGGAGGGFSAANRFFGGFATGGIIAEPSLITGLRSGITHVAGEAGEEAIVPVKHFSKGNRNYAMNTGPLVEQARGESDGGSMNVTVNISGQFIEGDQSKWQQLIKGRIVPELRRWTQSNPNGPFERKRGSLT